MKTKFTLHPLIKRYSFVLLMVTVYLLLMIFNFPVAGRAIRLTGQSVIEMMAALPPIFILLGLLDVWVPRKTMIRFTGEDSGIIGILIAFLLGSFAAGPLYAAFPVAGMMLKKGSKLINVLILIGAWSTAKIPLVLFEANELGLQFMLSRYLLNIPVILLIAFIIEKTLPDSDRRLIYKTAEEMA